MGAYWKGMASKERIEWGGKQESQDIGDAQSSFRHNYSTSASHTPRICNVRGTVYRMDDGSRGSCVRMHMRGRKLFMYLAL